MSVRPIDILGGESVYCFNQAQLKGAFDLSKSEGASGDKIRAAIADLEDNFSRNERAAVAFVVIDRLLKSVDQA